MRDHFTADAAPCEPRAVTVTEEEIKRRIGEVVNGRYALAAHVGTGGQGAVYRAIDKSNGAEVAVKVLHEAVDKDPTARERLVREGNALAALRGTAAIQVFDMAFTNDGRLCMVTELLAGEDLEDHLLRQEGAGKTFPKEAVPEVFGPIAETLEKAHALGIVHRDLKPQNVFLQTVPGGTRVRLMDFGFAKISNMSKLTMEGFVAGSPSYLAPETWAQKPVAPSVDIYALGAMIFRALAGRPPFVEKNIVALLRSVTMGKRPSLHAIRPDIPAAADAWVDLALAVDPAKRYQSPTACYGALCAMMGVVG